MKKLGLIILALLCATASFAIEKSQTIVVVNGSKFYVHTVQAGETLYSISKAYEVGEQLIVEHNPSASAGLRVDEKLKIPFVASFSEVPSERKLRKSFDMHFVAAGETLYAISRRYSIPIQTIIEDNPNLDPIHLRLDERILIRREERGTEPVGKVQAQWEDYRNNLNSVAEQGTAYHIIHAGETFYSISHRFGVSEPQLSALNDGLQSADLKAGAIIKVPISTTEQPQLATPSKKDPTQPVYQSWDESTQITDNQSITPTQTERSDFKPLKPSATLNIALLLPISIDGTANANFLEFYQGFLLGLDSVKRQGYSVHLDLYNTGRSIEKVREIVESDDFNKIDLIIGPVYEETLEPVLRVAERKGIPVVSPLALITHTNSDVLFQLSPVPERKYDKAADLIDGSKKLTLIYTDRTDKEFEAEILDLLGASDYKKHRYRYDHSRTAGGASDFTPLLQNSDDNVFVVMSDNEVEVDRILAAIASANTSLVGRGFTAPQFVVLGNARWNRYNNIDRSMFFKDRIVFFSTYHAKRDAEVVRTFDSNYIRAFGSLPTLYSYRGYDSALLFGLAMFGDIQYDMEGPTYTPLQTTYIFGQEEGSPNHVNRNWTRVNYNGDFTISIE